MVDPRSKALVLNGKPGHLQFYSLKRDKLLYNVRILLYKRTYKPDQVTLCARSAAFKDRMFCYSKFKFHWHGYECFQTRCFHYKQLLLF